jgi:hypothetical protein
VRYDSFHALKPQTHRRINEGLIRRQTTIMGGDNKDDDDDGEEEEEEEDEVGDGGVTDGDGERVRGGGKSGVGRAGARAKGVPSSSVPAGEREEDGDE